VAGKKTVLETTYDYIWVKRLVPFFWHRNSRLEWPRSPSSWNDVAAVVPKGSSQGTQIPQATQSCDVQSRGYSGWWFQPLWKILVNGKDYPIYYGK
jgi:hypothetical protein